MRVFIALLIVVGALGLLSPWGVAQTALEEWAKLQISEKTGIDPNLLATLFVTDGSDQLMLAFVYITQEVLESNLKPEIKQAIASYVDQRALLALVVPTRLSSFSPLEISFSQNGIVYLINAAQVHPITEDFKPGQLEANVVSAGVIELPVGINMQQSFEIRYRGSFSTTLAVTSTAPATGTPAATIPFPLLFLLQLLLFFFLFPFLLGI
jgi:hypothetical protein